ncbi:MAG: hypothetical protein K8W52_36185 [Deltaproteobacteria bacterium]|nr:hypothetical protein [Deltaproteobacteria bacterium]
MSKLVVAIGACLVLASCARPARAPASVAGDGGGADLDGVVRACGAALDRADALGAGRAGTVSACAQLFAQPTCRDAWVRANRVGLLELDADAAAACRDAYCGSLEGAGPACAGGPIDAQGWAELDARILTHDLGPSRVETVTARARARAHAQMVAPIELTPSPRVASLPQLAGCDPDATVTVAITASGALIDGGAGAPRALARCAGAIDGAALGAELRALRSQGCSDAVSIAATPSSTYADVVAVMDAAYGSGYTSVGVDTNPPAAARVAPVEAPSACPSPPVASAAPSRAPLPAPGAASVAPSPRAPLSRAPIVVVSTRAISLDDVELATLASLPATGTIGALTTALGARPGAPGDGTLIIMADRSAPAGAVARVLESARAAGFGNVMFAVKNQP